MERRGRPGSGPQHADHGIEDECADLAAVAAATGSTAAFGHSFGGLVVLETARRRPVFDQLFVYDPGVPLRGQIAAGWLDGYQRLLDSGDRRGAFAWMVKNAGVAPGPIGSMPLRSVRLVLHLVMRGSKWSRMDRLLDANLVEHRLQAALDAPSPDRFSTITAHTILLGGAKSPETLSSGSSASWSRSSRTLRWPYCPASATLPPKAIRTASPSPSSMQPRVCAGRRDQRIDL